MVFIMKLIRVKLIQHLRIFTREQFKKIFEWERYFKSSENSSRILRDFTQYKLNKLTTNRKLNKDLIKIFSCI